MLFPLLLGSCREDDFGDYDFAIGPNGEVMFNIGISDVAGTRAAVDESKKAFAVGELLHVRAIYKCETQNVASTERQYGIIKYAGDGSWEPFSEDLTLRWPDNAISGSFDFYYINGSNGALSGNDMPATLLSDYKFDQIPMHGEVEYARYGQAIRVQMTRLFSLLTLTDLKEGVANELWFTLPAEKDLADPEMYVELNNAFTLKFDPSPDSFEMTPVFSREPDSNYLDSEGNPLVFIKSRLTQTNNSNGVISEQNFLLEPKLYRKFTLLYPRTRDSYATYLNYTGDLKEETGDAGFVANGRYKFSVLKSQGIIVEETPTEGWDESEPDVIIDLEEFLHSVNNGTEYYGTDKITGEQVLVLESTTEGTRLLHNVDFNYKQYDVFENGPFRPTLSNTLDGNYHYIYHLGCPLFNANNGVIINLGLKDCETKTPITSTENLERYGMKYDNSHNGFVACTNNGRVNNLRVSNAKMHIHILTSDPDEPAQEAHDAAILFGVNRGNVYDLHLAGDLELIVENHPDTEYVPSVSIGGVSGQNIETFYGIDALDEEGFAAPEIRIYNKCAGDNGVYRMGGIIGNNMGDLYDAVITKITVDASESKGVESYLGGVVGESPYSGSGAPAISGCMIRGEVVAGEVNALQNLNSYSYAGGVAGLVNIQTNVIDNSISVGVQGSPFSSDEVEYAEGGAFGAIITTTGALEGSIQTLACYGSKLSGQGFIGNFAGITPAGFDWSHYEGRDINLRSLVGANIGRVGIAASGKNRPALSRKRK